MISLLLRHLSCRVAHLIAMAQRAALRACLSRSLYLALYAALVSCHLTALILISHHIEHIFSRA